MKIARQQTLPALVKGSSIYKMVIPESVESKIRYLQNKFPATEWSGVLFYTHSGSFEDGDLTITCKDIYPMDLGNTGYTEFFMSEEVTAYIADHCNDLWECDLGLVHSHHSMAAFFSGTDTGTLRSEGADRNCFVSLIVNNEGTYCAAVTRRLHIHSSAAYTASYRAFGDDSVLPVSVPDAVDEYDVIEYFMLDIGKPVLQNAHADLDLRFAEISRRKQQSRTSTVRTEKKEKTGKEEKALKSARKELSLFPDYEAASLPSDTDGDMPWSHGSDYDLDTVENIDPAAVHEAVTKLLLCSLIVNPEKINLADLDKWVRNSMQKVYDKYFGSPSSTAFTEYADWAVEYMLTHFFDFHSTAAQPQEEAQFTDRYWSSIAAAVDGLLATYDNGNPYINAYRDTLSFYMNCY